LNNHKLYKNQNTIKIAKNILSKLLSVIISLNALLIIKFLSF